MELSVSEIVGIGVESLIIGFALKAYILQRFLKKKFAEKPE
jgi:uncharacterized protein YneF (UPF0154 family)